LLLAATVFPDEDDNEVIPRWASVFAEEEEGRLD